MPISPEESIDSTDYRLKPLFEERQSSMTEEILELVGGVCEEEIGEAKSFVDEDIERDWEIYLLKNPDIDKLDPRIKENLKYQKYFNNFKMRLPGYYYKKPIFQRYKGDSWDITYKEWLDNFYDKFGANEEERKNYGWYSELRLKQTGKEFIGTIYACIDDSGLSIAEIVQKQDEMNDSIEPEIKDFFKFVMPVYLRLIALGYNRRDLIK